MILIKKNKINILTQINYKSKIQFNNKKQKMQNKKKIKKIIMKFLKIIYLEKENKKTIVIMVLN